MPRGLPIAVLVSGEGTTLEGLAQRVAAGTLDARIALVLSDRPGARALERARRLGLDSALVARAGRAPEAWGELASERLLAANVELVVLAGFLSILPAGFLERWRGRVINVHPSLLPRFGGPGMYGRRVLEAVLGSGASTTGVTVHLVTPEVDAGPPLWQASIPIRAGETPETLRERLRPLEIDGLARVIGAFADGTRALPFRAEPGARSG